VSVSAGEARIEDPLLTRTPAGAVLRLGFPLALGLASHALINIVDLLLVGQLGGEAIQAAHVATTWNFLPMIVGNCVSMALLAQLSRCLGRSEIREARQLHRRAQWFMLWLSVVVALVSTAPAGPMIDVTGLAGATRDQAVHYLVVSNLGCVPMFLLMQTTAAMRAAGEAMAPLALLLFANLLNLALDIVLLFGWQALGIPSFGVLGAAYATVTARTIAAALAFLWLARWRHPLSLRAVRRVAVPVMGPLLKDAWPMIVQIGLRAGLVLQLTIVVQRRFGDSATVALGITARLDTLILFGSLGFANAATAYAARAVVSGLYGRARAAGLWGALAAGLFGVALVLCLQRWAQVIVNLFLPQPAPAVVAASELYLNTAAWGHVLGAIALGAIGAVHGAGRMIAPLVVDVLGFGVATGLLGGAYLMGVEMRGVYLTVVLGLGCVALAQIAHVLWGRWATPVRA
jgi:putative MATE family efflux protein